MVFYHSLLGMLFRSNPPEKFLEKGVLKTCSKSTGEHPCQSVILIKNAKHVGMGVLLSICYIFSEHLFLRTPMEGCFWPFYSGYLLTVQIFKRGCCLFYFLYFFLWIRQCSLIFLFMLSVKFLSTAQLTTAKKLYQLLRHDLRDFPQTHKTYDCC